MTAVFERKEETTPSRMATSPRRRHRHRTCRRIRVKVMRTVPAMALSLPDRAGLRRDADVRLPLDRGKAKALLARPAIRTDSTSPSIAAATQPAADICHGDPADARAKSRSGHATVSFPPHNFSPSARARYSFYPAELGHAHFGCALHLQNPAHAPIGATQSGSGDGNYGRHIESEIRLTSVDRARNRKMYPGQTPDALIRDALLS